MNDSLTAFIRCLRSADDILSAGVGLGPGIEEIADMLWLAEHLPESADNETDRQDDDDQNKSEPVSAGGNSSEVSESKEMPQQGASDKLVTHSGSLSQSSKPLMVPAAAALRQPLKLARSLRALARKTESRVEKVIDEEATAIAIAEKNPVSIIRKPAQERWLDLELIVEQSRVSSLWEQTSKEFIELLERLGAFRTVRVWTLRTQTDEEGNPNPVLTAGLRSSQGKSNRAGKHKELVDSSGRRLIMLLSDCISPLWRQGMIHNWLADWGKNGPTVVVQWFPAAYWARTGLKSGDEVWLSALSPGIANNCLIRQYVGMNPEEWAELEEETYKPKSLVIPVVSLEPDSLGNWSQVVAGFGGVQAQGRRFQLSWDGMQWRGPIKRPRQLPGSGAERVQLFLETASEMAKELARLMALGPVSPEITNLIQETLLPQSGAVHVAEVFLSGLLEASESGSYQFVPDVKELLQEAAVKVDEKLVFQALSRYISDRYRQTPREFKAFLGKHSDWNEAQWNEIEGFAELWQQRSEEKDNEPSTSKFREEFENPIWTKQRDNHTAASEIVQAELESKKLLAYPIGMAVLLALIVDASVNPVMGAGLISTAGDGIVGNRANASLMMSCKALVRVLRQQEAVPMREVLGKALWLSYLQALKSVCAECKAELVGPDKDKRIDRSGQVYYPDAVRDEIFWLNGKLKQLEQEIRVIEWGDLSGVPEISWQALEEWVEPQLGQNQASGQGIRQDAAAALVSSAHEPGMGLRYQQKLSQAETGLFERICDYFSQQLARDAALQAFFEMQLLMQINGNLSAQQITFEGFSDTLSQVAQDVRALRHMQGGDGRLIDAVDLVIGEPMSANLFGPLGGRIDSPDQFFGREQTLQRIFEVLNSGSSVALIGEREIGKSSLLKAVEAKAKEALTVPRQPIYLDLRNVADEDDFYYALCDKVGIPECKGFRLSRELQSKRLLLMLDEMEKMTWDGFTNQVRGQLRGLAEGKEAPLRLVVAASKSLNRLFPDSTESNMVSPLSDIYLEETVEPQLFPDNAEGNMVSPLLGICLEETVEPWNEDTIRAFITDRLKTTSIRFSEAKILKIIQVSEGKPRKVMNLCYQHYAILQGQR
jgi:hypothetical protein